MDNTGKFCYWVKSDKQDSEDGVFCGWQYREVYIPIQNSLWMKIKIALRDEM